MRQGLFDGSAVTAFFPAIQKAIDVIQSGTIGTVRYINTFVSYRDADVHPILFDPNLAGGARIDLGIYPWPRHCYWRVPCEISKRTASWAPAALMK